MIVYWVEVDVVEAIVCVLFEPPHSSKDLSK